MTHVNVGPSNVRLVKDGFLVMLWILTGVNGSIVEPISDGATKGVSMSQGFLFTFLSWERMEVM